MSNSHMLLVRVLFHYNWYRFNGQCIQAYKAEVLHYICPRPECFLADTVEENYKIKDTFLGLISLLLFNTFLQKQTWEIHNNNQVPDLS